jgi:universal stress protein E
MNEKIRRILVSIRDPKRAPVSQLRKAAAIARASGASLELFNVVESLAILDPKDAEPLDLVALQALQRLEKLPLFKGLRVQSHIVRDYPAHEAILKQASKSRADLVVAAPRPRSLGARLVLTNTDWELIRRCPCPLLLVKSKGDYHKPNILTAIDPFHTHAKPANLDSRLLTVGNAWAQLLKGQSHAFHAFLPLAAAVPMPSGQPMGGWLSPEIEALHQAQVTSAFKDLVKQAGIAPRNQHLTVGSVATELKRIERKTHARIVVMGAISRGALKRLLIGSTAERVLDDSTCDILIVKPPAASVRSARGNGVSRLKAA